jgi:hypothetical protein
MKRLLVPALVGAMLVAGSVPAAAASAGVSAMEAKPAADETPAGGSHAAPYILVGLGVLLAIMLVIGTADTSDYDREPGF